ncbi:MAG: amidohydrolase family protein [Bacteroidetes bacterium]|nr:amidohydrolase family protein [Bacteroidota bacterium]
MERRDFLKTTALSALAPSLYLQSCGKSSAIPVIDTHVHLWDLDMLKLRWVRPPLDRDFLMDDYLKAVSGQNVVKSIYMEVGAPPEIRELEAEWALGLCSDPDNSMVAAVIAKDPTDEDFAAYMQGFEGNKYLKGIRYFFSSGSEIIEERVIQNIRLLGEMGYSFDLGIPPRWLPMGIRLVDACPGTHFVLNHCGTADPMAFFPADKQFREPEHGRDEWIRDMESIAQRPNVICKISGIAAHVPDYPLTAEDLTPIINHCLDQFGPDRVVFAGDWPVVLRNMPLASWIHTLKEVVAMRPMEEQRKLFHDNAEKFYSL